MTYLAFHSRQATVHLAGREVHHIAALGLDALTDVLAQPGLRQMRAELGLPPADSMFFQSQVYMLISDAEPRRVQGRDVYLSDVALDLLYRSQPAAGILCWLFDHALGHGWVAHPDRHAFAQEIQQALDAGAARPGMGWDAIIAFLRGGAGDVFTSLSIGNEFPDCQLALDSAAWQPAGANPGDSAGDLEGLWDRLGDDQQWDLCALALRAWPARQWRPGGTGYLFGDFTIQPAVGLVPARRTPR